MSTPPLSWTIDVNAVSNSPLSSPYEATAGELATLERYLEVEQVSAFSATVRVNSLGHGKFRAAGRWNAAVIQASVVSLEAVTSQLGEDFSVEYWPAEAIESAEDDTVSLDKEPPEAIVDGHLPIGNLLSELLALALDPYPRNEGDALEWVSPELEKKESPFAGLVQLGRKNRTGESEK